MEELFFCIVLKDFPLKRRDCSNEKAHMLQFHGQSAHISLRGETTQYRTDLEDLITHYAGIDFNPSTY